jgi:peroxiredoxin
LRRLAERFAQKPLAILAISVGEVDVRVRRFFDADPVNFPVLLDRDKAVSKAWQVSTLPTTFVLDRSLKPRFMVEGDFDWDRADSDQKLSTLATHQINRGAH